jgi:hypothetical protein
MQFDKAPDMKPWMISTKIMFFLLTKIGVYATKSVWWVPELFRITINFLKYLKYQLIE